MIIAENKSVFIDFELKDDHGEIIDSSEGQEPLNYIHGHGSLIAGLEKALEGKSIGTDISVKLSPEEGYGQKNPDLIQKLSQDQLSGTDELKLGMQLQLKFENGDDRLVTVTDLDDQYVTFDGNHPLAGQNLNFEVTVRDIRDASQEQLSKVKSNCSCC
jgi:FKBP-type peptidyl-prolyl cis-trans isomerase SlyD